MCDCILSLLAHFTEVPTPRFWSSQTSVVTAESFSDRSGPL